MAASLCKYVMQQYACLRPSVQAYRDASVSDVDAVDSKLHNDLTGLYLDEFCTIHTTTADTRVMKQYITLNCFCFRCVTTSAITVSYKL